MSPETVGKSLRIEALAKTYQSRSGRESIALTPVDCTIAAGEFVAVVGPTGCGKTTLLKILAGVIAPSSGRALVDGQPISGPSIDRSVVFQNFALFPWLSVLANVEFGLRSQGIAPDECRRIATEFLRTVGLLDAKDKRPSELSGGMKQRCAIARAFAVRPSILLMDEPFGALDALTRRVMQRELVRIWREHRTTVVFITHAVEEAIFLADRILVMTAHPGRIKAELRVESERPRDETAPDFLELEREIYKLLDEELVKSFYS
jgi:ABC-type nitrate/sulfonate/bicarbonate transport system ATPase subunit